MIFNKICHLSEPIIRKKKQTKNEFIEERKKYFKEHLQNRTTTYKGKLVKLAKCDEPGDACFNKFVIGGENFHKTNTIDFRRLERLNWIFEILDNFDKCKKCNQIFSTADTKHKNRTLITCIQNKYKIVIALGYSKNNDCYTIITAFYIR